jgi:hypothetical protein
MVKVRWENCWKIEKCGHEFGKWESLGDEVLLMDGRNEKLEGKRISRSNESYEKQLGWKFATLEEPIEISADSKMMA